MTVYFPPQQDPIAQQTEGTYRDYIKIKGFEDVGHFLQNYVIDGAVATKNIYRNNVVDLTGIVAVIAGSVVKRDGASFVTAIPDAIYYLDFEATGDFWFGVTHAPGAAETDYITLAEVTTDANANVDEITDKADPRGGFRLSSTYGLEGYATSAELADIAISVKSFGALGDGLTDDTVAIMNTITAMNGKGILYFPPASGYATTDTITVPAGIPVQMDAPIVYSGTGKALIVGSNTANTSNVAHKINVLKSTTSDWTSESSIGVKIINHNACPIEIIQARDFTIGVQCMGSAAGFAYNQISLGSIINNKIGVDLTNEISGYNNENVFFNGRISCFTGINVGKSRYGVRITSKDGTYTSNNNNNFIKPCFELKAAQANPGEAIPILIEHGNLNSFTECRTEDNSATFARVSNASSSNIFEAGFGDVVVDDQSSAPYSGIYSRRIAALQQASNLVFDSGPLHKRACYYDGASTVNIPCVHIGNSTTANVLTNANSITLNTDYLELAASRAVGIFVKTSYCKRFVVRRDAVTGFGGRISIRAYDASGNILTSAGANHPYVKGLSFRSFSYTTNYGGTYRTGTDTNEDIYFSLGSDVDYIVVLVHGVTNPLRIRSFSIFTNDLRGAATWVGYEEVVPGVNLAITPPTAGTWPANRWLINAVRAVGQPKGWMNTATGTPGTWVSEGNL